jgi:hypothetical protein
MRAWLNQFDTPHKERVAFKILQNLRFYDNYVLKIKLQEIYRNGAKELEWHIKGKKRQDILVSYLDQSLGKSGSEYAKSFADSNNIYYENIVVPDRVISSLKKKKEIKGLVFVDDIIGSGKSICENLEIFFSNKELSEILENRNIKIYIGIICGFQKAKNKVERLIKKLNLDITLYICDILDHTDSCFSEESSIFPEQNERMEAKAVCYEYGYLLEKRQPLGFSGNQTLIVFPNTCPNNSLPILWKKTKEWMPLFERPGASK